MSAAPQSWPRLGLGCAALGSPDLDDRAVESVIAAAIERGIRFFDVAPLYGGGLAEERLGRALARLSRDEYLLCTKAGVTRAYGQTAMPPGATRRREFDRWDFSAGATRASVMTSLERLRTDRLDIVHLHDVEDHLDTCLEAHAELDRLRERRIVGGVGIGSNLPGPVRTLIDRAPFSAILLAGCYTLLDQSGRALIETARSRDIAVVVGGVFNSGVLAAWPQAAPTFGYAPASPAIAGRTARIASLCERHRVPLAAAALQFALAHPAIATVLIGPRTLGELESNLRAACCEIPEALWDELEAVGIVPAGSPRPSPARTRSVSA